MLILIIQLEKKDRNINLRVVLLMKGNGWAIKEMVMEHKFGQMVQSMKDNGMIIRPVGLGLFII